MHGHLIRTKEEHSAALAEIQSLLKAEKGTAEGDRLEYLVLLVEYYEQANFPMDVPDPIAAIEFASERSGRTFEEIADLSGDPMRFASFMQGGTALTLPMVWALNEQLGISIEVLAQRPS
jgi:HTH-type transcriptional regulator/antitoxin HigA